MSPHLVPGLGRVVMVVPTYDEALNLPLLVERLRAAQPDVDLLVVDDNSPDGTGAIADKIAAADPQVSVLHRTSKEGLGAAYLHGFRVALDRGYDVIGEMDADGSHQPEELHRLLAALRDADLVIGSRWVPGGSIVNWPLHRQLLSRGGNAYIRTLLGIGVRDATAGFRLFRRTTLEQLPLEEIASLGYVFQADLAFRAVRSGTARRRGADRVRRARARRLEDEPAHRQRVVPADHAMGARRAQPTGPGRAAWPSWHQQAPARTPRRTGRHGTAARSRTLTRT